MNRQSNKQKNVRKSWTLPQPNEIEDALAYFSQKPRKPVKRTINFKLHNLTKRKIHLLLELHVYLTNLVATILKVWREDSQQSGERRAVAHIFKTQKSGVYGRFRASVLADAIEDYFEPNQLSDSHVLHRLRVGSYRSCAQILVNWAQKTANVLAAGRKNTILLNERIFYEGWATLNRAYKQAMQIVVSLGFEPEDVPWQKLYQLERRSKYEARWILERLRSETELRQVLTYVETLLNDEPSALQREAASIEHPWLKQPSSQNVRHHRSVRESWFLQRVIDTPGNLVILNNLYRNELEDLRDQLQTMLAYIERGERLIEAFEQTGAVSKNDSQTNRDQSQTAKQASTKRTTRASSSQPKRSLRTILETFLYAKPPRFPLVQHVRLADDTEDDQSQMVWYDTHQRKSGHSQFEHPTRTYTRYLNWFRLNPNRKNDAARFTSANNESKAVHGLFRVLQALKLPRLQPIHFISTTRPVSYRDGKSIKSQYRGFALLYEKINRKDRKTGKQREVYRYVLATFTHEAYDRIETNAQRLEKERRAPEIARYRLRRQQNPLYYVNFPYTPFQPPVSRHVTLFPLECGNTYHEEQFLQKIMETQRKAQEEAHKTVNLQSKEQRAIEKCLPEFAPIASAKITCTWNTPQQPEFYLHATITEPVEEVQPVPLRVIGISIYSNRYAFAVLELDGTIQHIGDVFIPKYLNPAFGAKRNSSNYVYWIANSIVEEALWWQAYIGIQDVSWQKNHVSIDHNLNQRLFSGPVQRIESAILIKAQVAGLMKPRLVHDISPTYDCAVCRIRLNKGVKTLSNEWSMTCPKCRFQQKLVERTHKQPCTRCQYLLPSPDTQIRFEQCFSCPRCYTQPRLARHNLAIVVAQKMLIDTVKHHHNALAQEERVRSKAA